MEEKKELIEQYFNLVHPEFDSLSDEKKAEVADDYDLIRDNIDKMDQFFQEFKQSRRDDGTSYTGREMAKMAYDKLVKETKNEEIVKNEETQQDEVGKEENIEENNIENLNTEEIDSQKENSEKEVNESEVEPQNETTESDSKEKMRTNKLKLLQEYMNTKAQLQFYRARVRIAMFQKSSKEAVENSVNGLKNYITTTAENYSQKISQKYNGYKQIYHLEMDYQGYIEEIEQEYDDNMKQIEQKISELEQKECELTSEKAVLYTSQELEAEKQEIGNLFINGNIEEATKRAEEYKNKVKPLEDRQNEIDKEIEEIRKQKEECEEKVEELQLDIAEQLETSRIMKNEEFHRIGEEYMIVPTSHRNIISKAVSWIRNKINGTKYYTKDVIEPLQKGVVNIKDKKIPKIKETLKTETNEFLKSVDNKTHISERTSKAKEASISLGSNIKDTVVTNSKNMWENIKNAVDTVKENVWNKPKKSFYSFLASVQNYKESLIESTINTIAKDKKEIQEKILQMDGKEQEDDEIEKA